MGVANSGDAALQSLLCQASPSNHDQPQARSEPSEIVRVAGHHRLPGPLRTDHDMSIGNVSRPCLRQQKTNACCIRPIQRDKVRARLANEARKTSLLCRIPHGLRQCRGGNRDTHATLGRPGQQRDHSPIVPVQRNESTGIEGNAAHAALRFRRGCGESNVSAHARSFAVSGPPVRASPSFSISRHPAAS